MHAFGVKYSCIATHTDFSFQNWPIFILCFFKFGLTDNKPYFPFLLSFSCCLAFGIVNKLSKYLTNCYLCPATYSVHAMKLKKSNVVFFYDACTKKLLTWQVNHKYNK